MRTTSQIVLNTNHFGFSQVVQPENRYGKDNKHLKVVGLKNNTDYVVHWYSFVDGYYLESQCQNTTSSGKLELKHPVLYPYTSPILWFVLEQADCQGSGMVTQNDETETQNSDSDSFIDRAEQTDLGSENSSSRNPENLNWWSLKLYPNPFNDEIIIESQTSDRLSIYSPSGQLIQTIEVQGGRTIFRTDILQKGLYLFQFENQSKIFKLVKN